MGQPRAGGAAAAGPQRVACSVPHCTFEALLRAATKDKAVRAEAREQCCMDEAYERYPVGVAANHTPRSNFKRDVLVPAEIKKILSTPEGLAKWLRTLQGRAARTSQPPGDAAEQAAEQQKRTKARDLLGITAFDPNQAARELLRGSAAPAPAAQVQSPAPTASRRSRGRSAARAPGGGRRESGGRDGRTKKAKLESESAFFKGLEGLPPAVQRARIREKYWKDKTVYPADSLPSWKEYISTQAAAGTIQPGGSSSSRPINITPADVAPRFPCSAELNGVVCLWKGDITTLEADGIVNAANSRLSAGHGVCGAIHSAAGPLLQAECDGKGMRPVRCPTGKAVVTKGYRLPAKHVLHAVGPEGEKHKQLEACYRSVLDQAARQGMQSVAFCCVSTGIYDFPLLPATHRALCTVRKWLDKNKGKMKRVVFCVFQAHELAVYERLLPSYFPRESDPQLSEGTPAPPTPGDDATTPPDRGTAAGASAAAGPDQALTTPYVRGLCGLKNLSNSCYMNSGLQCLSNSPELRDYFLSGQYNGHINTENILGTGGRMAHAFAMLMHDMWSGRHETVEPQIFYDAVCSRQPRFAGGGQHDAEELVGCVLDALHEDTNRVLTKTYVEDPDEVPPQDAAELDEFERKRAAAAWERHLARNQSQVDDLFLGLVRSHLCCNVCGREGLKYDPARAVQVPVKRRKQREGGDSGQPLDLAQCLARYGGVEQLDEGNGWDCPTCKTKVMAYKRLSLWQPPKHLILLLKRFSYGRTSGVRKKVLTPVNFPVDGLDIAPLLSPSSPWAKLGRSGGLRYDLYATANHSGAAEGGHYTACCKNSTQEWYRFNDSKVDKIDKHAVAGGKVDAYLLFYRLQDNLDGGSSPSEGGESASTGSES